MRYLFFY